MTHFRKNAQHRELWNSVREHYKEPIIGFANCVSDLREGLRKQRPILDWMWSERGGFL